MAPRGGEIAKTDAAPWAAIEERIEAMKRWKEQVNATYPDQESRRKRPFVSRFDNNL